MRYRSVLLGLLLSISPCIYAFNVARSYRNAYAFPSYLLFAQHNDGQDSQLLQTASHPDAICWSSTLDKSPNSYVHPSVQLAIRPLSEGGTGIIATEDIPANTTVISLAVDEVPVIDAAVVIERYKKHANQNDEVMNMFVKLWHGVNTLSLTTKRNGEIDVRKDGIADKSDVLAGILAHLQLVRYRDLSPCHTVESSFASDESKRLGAFLDSMPLLPRDGLTSHPNPTNFIFWKHKEILLLKNTIAGELAHREVTHLRNLIREWSGVFLSEHPTLTLTDVIEAIESAAASLNSRAFGRGDDTGEIGEIKDGHFLVPLVDKMNHDGEKYNVNWDSALLNEEEEARVRAKGERVLFAVSTEKSVPKGEELLTSYGAKVCWTFARNYGFLPSITQARFASSGIPIFPAVLELSPQSDAKLDLRILTNYGPLLKALEAAVEKATKKKSVTNKKSSIAIVETACYSYLSAPKQLARYRPLHEVVTRIGPLDNANIKMHHRATIEAVLPAFRAAASAIAQLQYNHQNNIQSPIKLKQMVMAASAKDPNTDWNEKARNLMRDGIHDRLHELREAEKDADAWLKKVSVHYIEERKIRGEFAKEIRDSEIMVLESLEIAISEWE